MKLETQKKLIQACHMARQALVRTDHPQAEERRWEAYVACKEALRTVEEDEDKATRGIAGLW